MKKLIFIFLLFGASLNAQTVLTCYNFYDFLETDCVGCQLKDSTFSGIVIQKNGVIYQPLVKPLKIRTRPNILDLEDGFATRVSLFIDQIVTYNTEELVLEFLRGCVAVREITIGDVTTIIHDSLATLDPDSIYRTLDTIKLRDGSGFVKFDTSNTNEIQTIDTFSVFNDTLKLSLTKDGLPFSFVKLPQYVDSIFLSDYDLYYVKEGDTLFVGNFTDSTFVSGSVDSIYSVDTGIPDDNDEYLLLRDGEGQVTFDPSSLNELQTISRQGDTLNLSYPGINRLTRALVPTGGSAGQIIIRNTLDDDYDWYDNRRLDSVIVYPNKYWQSGTGFVDSIACDVLMFSGYYNDDFYLKPVNICSKTDTSLIQQIVSDTFALDMDIDSTNEIQHLGLTGHILHLTLSDSTVDLTPYIDIIPGLVNQTLRFSGTDTLQANSLLWNTGERIGIGTTSPAKILDVNGDALIHGHTVGRGSGSLSTNLVLGLLAMFSNTTGYSNTALGVHSLYANTTGNQNVAVGYQALRFNTEGGYNTATGYQALYSNTTGTNNTANGFFALRNNTTGDSNTATGLGALESNTTGVNNTANGVGTLGANTTGSQNSANGVFTLQVNTTGNNNTANGVSALSDNTTGSNNTADGQDALSSNTTGQYNTAVGSRALVSNVVGSANIAIGYNAGALNTASNRLYIEAGDSQTPLIGGQIDNNRVGINTHIDSISQTLHVTGNIRGTGSYVDATNSTGTSGQVLSSTVTGTDWIDLPASVSDSTYIRKGWGITLDSVGNTYTAGVDSSQVTSIYQNSLKQDLISGTDGQTLRFNGTTLIANSLLYNNGTDIGIGTITPTYKLDIAGTLRATTTSDFGVKFNSSNSTRSTLNLNNTGGGDPFLYLTQSDAARWAIGYEENGSTNDFKIRSGTASMEEAYGSTKFLIQQNTGNVGIGTSSPAKILDVNGDALVNGLTVGKGNGSVSFNTALGVSALASITTGNYNIGLGSGALQLTTDGASNVAIGSGALNTNVSGTDNVAIGRNALNVNLSSNNFALGSFSMSGNTTGNNNVMIGYLSGQSNTTGSYNVGIGQQVLRTGTSKSYNVGLGYFALAASNGNGNIGIGAFAGGSITSGTNNTVIGYGSGATISTNGGMVALGYQSGRYETGADKFFVNNFDTGSESNDRAKSIIYGVMSSTTANQTLALNAYVTSTYGLQTTTARITDSYGTSTTIAGRDGSGYVSAITPSYGISLASNLLKVDTSALVTPYDISGFVAGTGAQDKLSIWSSTTTQTYDNLLHWNPSAQVLGVGTASPSTGARAHIADGDLFIIGGSNRRFLMGSSVSTGFWGGMRWNTSNELQMIHSGYNEATGFMLTNSSGYTGFLTAGTTPTTPVDIFSSNSSDNGTYQKWAYSASPTNYALTLKQTVTGGNVRYNFSQVNAGTAYDNVFVMDQGNVAIGHTDATEKLDVNGDIRGRAAYVDATNSPGTSGQVLSSTVTGTDWIDLPAGDITAVTVSAPVTGSSLSGPIPNIGVDTTDATAAALATQFDLLGKQATLVSGTNIKTVNSNSLVGSGNVSVGTVTSITAAAPLTGGAITTSGTIGVDTTATTGSALATQFDISSKGTMSQWGYIAPSGTGGGVQSNITNNQVITFVEGSGITIGRASGTNNVTISSTSAYDYWRISAAGGTAYAVTDDALIDFANGTGITWSRSGGVMTATGVDAVANSSTKGVATFTTNDFNSSSGNISLDYTNGQEATAGQDGFLSSGNWTTFNNKMTSWLLAASGTAGTATISNGSTATITAGTSMTATRSSGNVTVGVANSGITTTQIADGTVALADMASTTGPNVLGRVSGTSGAPTYNTIGTGLEYNSNQLTATTSHYGFLSDANGSVTSFAINTTPVKVDFDTPLTGLSGTMTVSSASDNITVTAAGGYEINYGVCISGVSSTRQISIAIYKNSSSQSPTNKSFFVTSGDEDCASGNHIMILNASDVIDLRIATSGSETVTLTGPQLSLKRLY